MAESPAPASYSVAHWGTDDGLPSSSIYDIRQTEDGYLWMATTAGLVRFDGRRMRVFNEDNSSLVNFRLFRLHVTATGQLWSIAEDGTIMEGTSAEFTTILPSTPRVRNAAMDGQGRTWLLRSEWVKGGFAAARLILRDEGREIVTDQFTKSRSEFFRDSHGDLWVRLLSGEAARLEGDRFVPQGTASTSLPLLTCPSRAEVLFKRAPEGGGRTEVVDLEGTHLASFPGHPDRVPWLVDRQGVLWVTRGSQMEAFGPGQDQPLWQRELVPGAIVLSMMEDTEGNIWIGTTTDGLFRVSAVPFRVFSRDEGISESEVYRVEQAPGGAVYATTDRGVYRVTDGRVELMMDSDRSPPPPVALLKDVRGTLWSRRGTGLIGSPAEGPGFAVTTPGHSLGKLLVDPHDPEILWFRDTARLHRIDPYGSDDGPEITDTFKVPRYQEIFIRQVIFDRAGTAWMVADSGIVRIRPDGVRHFTTQDGLPTDRIRTAYEDADGVLWFGTYGYGIIRYRNDRFEALGTEQGLGEEIVTSILEDSEGNFWMSGNRGVYRTPRSELNAVLDGAQSQVHSVRYGRQAGLLNPEASGYPGLRDRDGRLWFPTFGGLAVVEPFAALAAEVPPTAIHVEEISDGTRPWPVSRGLAVLPPNPGRLLITYTSIALRDPASVRFRYRLDGLEEDWVDAGTDRTASYTHLSPGRYMFHVQAISANSAWGDLEDTLLIEIQPALYQTAWFYALCGVAGLVGLYAAYRMRTARLTRRALHLECLVTQRTEELAREKDTVARQVDELRELEQAKSRFFSNISHEFRTPLTLIQGPLEDLRTGVYGSAPSPDAAEQLDIALSNSQRLLRLVDQLMAIARSESGKLTLQARPADFSSFMRRMVQALCPMARRLNIELALVSPEGSKEIPELYFEPEHLERVFTNLIGNALKFTPAGGHVTVKIFRQADPGAGDWVVTEVADDGPGIPEEDLERIFERFYRGTSPGPGYKPGTGIGLALAKDLVELHHGTIQVSAAPGQGSLFTVRLPLGRAHLDDSDMVSEKDAELLSLVDEEFRLESDEPLQEGPISPPSEPSSVAPSGDETTVLVVDDHPEVRGYLRRHLQGEYRVLEAANGRDGVEMARRSLPDLVISDVMMPVMDGFEMCRTLKDDPETDFIPIILLTAKASGDGRIAGLEERADDYVTKPFRIRELAARVRNLIDGRGRLKARFEKSEPRPLSMRLTPGPEPLGASDQEFLDRLRSAVEAHLGEEEFGVERLARAVGQSRATLYRKLKEIDGPSPVDLIRKVRLEHAAALLAQGAGSVSEVAYAVGFRSVSHFSTSFKEHHGSTPSLFRRDRRPND